MFFTYRQHLVVVNNSFSSLEALKCLFSFSDSLDLMVGSWNSNGRLEKNQKTNNREGAIIRYFRAVVQENLFGGKPPDPQIAIESLGD